ncbi:MAG: VOC family protein [Oscillospiraceae bacterium]|nr:VOC family protein [Oscillospiraceae bacterium]
MKRFSNVHQLGFVVEDLQEAMKEYGARYRVKRWYGVVNEPQGALFYKGKPFADSGYAMAIGYCGRTEIELITTAAQENIYTEFLRAHGPGLHHVSFFVRDIDAWVPQYEALGYEVVQNGVTNGKTMKARFAYMRRTDQPNGDIIEFCDVHAGRLPLTRTRWNIALGALTGDLVRL